MMLGCYDKPANQPNSEAVSFLVAECGATSEEKKPEARHPLPQSIVRLQLLAFFLLGFAFSECTSHP